NRQRLAGTRTAVRKLHNPWLRRARRRKPSNVKRPAGDLRRRQVGNPSWVELPAGDLTGRQVSNALRRELSSYHILRRVLVRPHREARRLVWDVIPRRPLVRSAGLSHKSIANPVDTAFGKGVEANVIVARLLAEILQADARISFPVVLADDLLNPVGKPRYYLRSEERRVGTARRPR